MSSREKTKTGFPFDPMGPDDPMLGRILADRYRVLRHLGDGSNARVYVAEQLSMGRNVAIKMLRDDLEVDKTAVARFRQEVEVASRLHSPHTIQFYDFGETDGQSFIVMELLAGENLQERIARDGRLGLADAWSVASQIASSLDEAHGAGVLHRDLKPANIHFCVHATPLRPFVKVLDFGLAKLEDPDEVNPTLTGRRSTVGTPAYMAPERVVEGRVVDHRSDLYSLAVICFEMLTGSRPFSGRTPMLMVLDHLNKPVPSVCEFVSGFPAGLDAFFQRSMAKMPDDRPSTAVELVGELEAALRGSG